MKSSTMLTKEMKEKIRQILTAEHMSSEESGSGEENEGRLLVVRPHPGDQMRHSQPLRA